MDYPSTARIRPTVLSGMNRWLLTTWLAVSVLGVSCADSSVREMPKYYDFGSDYELALVKVAEHSPATMLFPIQPAIDQRGACFSATVLQACIAPQFVGFWVAITNTSSSPLQLLSKDIRYIDEIKAAHSVYFLDDTPPGRVDAGENTVVLRPGETVRKLICPSYKTYNVAGQNTEGHVFHEPLVPTTLQKRDLAEMRTYVEDLMARQVNVQLMLPVSEQGFRREYALSFVLRHRWAADDSR